MPPCNLTHDEIQNLGPLTEAEMTPEIREVLSRPSLKRALKRAWVHFLDLLQAPGEYFEFHRKLKLGRV